MKARPMLSTFVDFFTLLLAALLVGTMFGTWLTANPVGLSASDYVVVTQQHIRALNEFMPRFGGATILFTIASAVLARADGTRLAMLVVAVLFFVTVGLITRFLNQPINAIVMTWTPGAAPANWTELRDTWWNWHLVRLALALLGLGLLILAMLRQDTIGG